MDVSAASVASAVAPQNFEADPDTLDAVNASSQQDQGAPGQEQDSATGGGTPSASTLQQRLSGLDVSVSITAQIQEQTAEQTQAQQQPQAQSAPQNTPSPAPANGRQGQGGQSESSRTSDQRFYDGKIEDASNPASAIGYTYLRDLNNAGHDIADGVTGLYTLATDKNARQQLASSVGNALEHPIDTAASAVNAGKNYLHNTSYGQMAEDALRFGAGALATAGAGKAAVVTGQVAKDAAINAGRTLASGAAKAGETVGSAGQMFSSADLMGVERASPELIASVASKRSVVIAQPGSDELKMLDYFGAEASANTAENGIRNGSIVLRENPSKAAVLEEFLHGTQARLGIVDRLGQSGMGSAETHVKDFMIRHQNMLGLSDEDTAILTILRNKGL